MEWTNVSPGIDRVQEFEGYTVTRMTEEHKPKSPYAQEQEYWYIAVKADGDKIAGPDWERVKMQIYNKTLNKLF